MKTYGKIDDFYIKGDEEYLFKDILPSYYVKQNLDKGHVSTDYALRFVQNELNELLHSFVNGGFSYKGYVLFPLVRGISRNNLEKIRKLKQIMIFLNDNGYDFSDSIKMYAGNIKNSKSFAILLSSLYQDFSSVKHKNTKLINKPKCQELNINSYKKFDLRYLKPLAELKNYANRHLKQYLAGFYLHGSLATKDYVKGWSDADTLAVVSKEAIENPEKLLGLRIKMYYMRHFLYMIDPLQHHGSIIISQYDLDNYCKVYFPVEIFKYAKSFFKEDGISKIRVRDCSSESLAKLFWFVNYFRRINIQKSYNMSSYDAKNLLHCITLFPTVYLNAKGIFVYKRLSFEMAKKDFKKEAWEVIDYASSIRRNWKNTGSLPFIRLGSSINPLLAYRLNSRVVDFFKDIKKINNINTKYLVENMFRLSEGAWNRIKNAKIKKVQFF